METLIGLVFLFMVVLLTIGILFQPTKEEQEEMYPKSGKKDKGDDYYNGISGIPGAEIYYKQFALPNMPTHWMEIPTHP